MGKRNVDHAYTFCGDATTCTEPSLLQNEAQRLFYLLKPVVVSVFRLCNME